MINCLKCNNTKKIKGIGHMLVNCYFCNEATVRNSQSVAPPAAIEPPEVVHLRIMGSLGVLMGSLIGLMEPYLLIVEGNVPEEVKYTLIRSEPSEPLDDDKKESKKRGRHKKEIKKD